MLHRSTSERRSKSNTQNFEKSSRHEQEGKKIKTFFFFSRVLVTHAKSSHGIVRRMFLWKFNNNMMFVKRLRLLFFSFLKEWGKERKRLLSFLRQPEEYYCVVDRSKLIVIENRKRARVRIMGKYERCWAFR